MKEIVFGVLSIAAIILGLAVAPGLIMAIWFETMFWLKFAGTCFLSGVWCLGLVKVGGELF